MTAPTTASPARPLLRRWPTVAGLAFAAFVGFDSGGGADLAPVLAAAAVVYLGAAALGKHGAAWPLFFGTVVVITVTRLVDDRIEPTWLLFGAGAVLLVYGLLRGALRPVYGLPLQTLALLAYGAVAAVGLLLHPPLGAYLVALGLLGHAAWDLYHFRTSRVVSPSLAEFCLVLDATLAVVIVALTALG
ncbi:MAG: hypothetical protein GEV07_07475 [Streptosporangiales bacterium]|nr:hypothetical protein [Streptosporangiales bacterium]